MEVCAVLISHLHLHIFDRSLELIAHVLNLKSFEQYYPLSNNTSLTSLPHTRHMYGASIFSLQLLHSRHCSHASVL